MSASSVFGSSSSFSHVAAAMTQIAPGKPLLTIVVPSIGSSATAIFTEPGDHVPRRSPLKMPGASSLMPSPIVTTPETLTVSNSPRIASHAAKSALSLSPLPIHLYAESAPTSVARTNSSPTRRSRSTGRAVASERRLFTVLSGGMHFLPVTDNRDTRVSATKVPTATCVRKDITRLRGGSAKFSPASSLAQQPLPGRRIDPHIPPPFAALDVQRAPINRAKRVLAEHLGRRSACGNGAVAEQKYVRRDRRKFLDVVGDEHDRWRRR